MKPKILFLYHFYFPDNVVSPRLFQDLCEDLAKRNWEVEVWPCNRNRHDLKAAYPAKEILNGVRVKRVWRPSLSQSSSIGRILNSIWMISNWSLRYLLLFPKPQIVFIGSDPVLALLAVPLIKLFDHKVRVVHWCFDLYPEAAVADGKVKGSGWLYRVLSWLMRRAYNACDLILDLGVCMRKKITMYLPRSRCETVTPWAFYEPTQIQLPAPSEKQALFGNATTGILYSGNFGLGHTADLTIKLAARLKEVSIRFCFSTQRNLAEKVCQKYAAVNAPIMFADFAAENSLSKRLEAAEIHLVSLKQRWTGTVVPSKFFGSLAAGRPVIFEGSEESAIAKWIREYQVGWVLSDATFEEVANQLIQISRNPKDLESMQKHCLEIYQEHFSKTLCLEKLQKLLKELV